MEIYTAISDFTPPTVNGSQNILGFSKGDKFEIYDCHKSSEDWWGARSLMDNRVGYVPSRYMQYEEKKIGKLLPTDYQSQKENSLKRLSDMQTSADYKAPEDMYLDLPEPEPDYNEDETDAKILHPVSESPEEFIQPKKLSNPCLESAPRQALHKELLLNYKRGVNVLEKPELNKVLQHRRETQRMKEWDAQKQSSTKRTSLEMKLEQRAHRLQEEDMEPIKETEEKRPEFQKVHEKITTKSNEQVK